MELKNRGIVERGASLWNQINDVVRLTLIPMSLEIEHSISSGSPVSQLFCHHSQMLMWPQPTSHDRSAHHRQITPKSNLVCSLWGGLLTTLALGFPCMHLKKIPVPEQGLNSVFIEVDLCEQWFNQTSPQKWSRNIDYNHLKCPMWKKVTLSQNSPE